MKIFLLRSLLLPSALLLGQANSQVGTIISTLQASEPDIVDQQALSQLNSYQSEAKHAAIQHLNATATESAVRKYYALACLYFATNGKSNPRTLEQLGNITLPRWNNESMWLTGEPCGTPLESRWLGIKCNSADEVTTIDLPSNNLYGTFPPEIVFLKGSLQILALSNNFFLHAFDDFGHRWIGQMTALAELLIGTTSFEYEGVPVWLNGATNLRKIDISNTYWTDGPVRVAAFENLTKLEYLNMSDNIYYSVDSERFITALEIPVMESLTTFSMERADFRPININLEFLCQFPALSEVWLDFTKFDGNIPECLGSISSLRSVSLAYTGIGGTIPANLGNTQIESMRLYGNELTGTIPTELGQLSELKVLFIEGNELGTGNPNAPHTLPLEICNLMVAELGVDCDRASNSGFVECTCCTCCAEDCNNFPDPTAAPTQSPTVPIGPPDPDCYGAFIFPGDDYYTCPLCFAGNSLVEVEDIGTIELSKLKIGDSVKVKGGMYEPVFSFGHYLPEQSGNFLQISTESGNKISISADHMIEISGGVFAPSIMVQTGSSLMINGTESNVVSVTEVLAQGIYAPFTPSGNIIVDGISVSCYVAFDKESTSMSIFGYNVSFQWLAHSFEFPHRLACHYMGSCVSEKYSAAGVSSWVEGPLHISIFMLGMKSNLIKSALFAIAVVVLSVFNLIEMVVVFQYTPVFLLIFCLIFATLAVNRRLKKHI